MDKTVTGSKVYEICELGDKLLAEGTSKVFKKEKEMKKGMYIRVDIFSIVAIFISF